MKNPKGLAITTKSKTTSPIHLIIVFTLPVLLYLQTVRFGFVYFDDDKIILNNSGFLSDLGNTIKVFKTDAFITGTSYFYRPLQTLSYMTDIQLSGGINPWIFHLSNLLLLGLIACSLYILLRRFNISSWLSLSGTLIFCAHPLFVSSVAWIPARGDLLLTLFSLFSFIFFMEYLKTKKVRYLLLNWLMFTAALFSKETAIILPLLFLIYYFTYSPEKRFERNHLSVLVLLGVSITCWFWLRLKAVGDFSNMQDVFDALGKDNTIGLTPIWSNLRTIPESLAQFFFPFNMAPIPGFSMIKTCLGLIIIILILAYLSFNNSGSPIKEKMFCILWFLLLMLPTMLFKHEHIDYLHHRFFIPLMGILLLVLFAVQQKWDIEAGKQGRWFMVFLILLLSVFTFRNSRLYMNPMKFYTSAVSKNPDSALAHNNLGSAYHQSGNFEMAVKNYTQAIQLKPDYASAYNNRGNAYYLQKSYEKAITDYTMSIELGLINAGTLNNRGGAYLKLKNYNKACSDFNKAAELGSKSARENIRKFCH